MSGLPARRLLHGGTGWWLAAAAAALHLLFARASVTVPYVFGDEAGYLTKAAALAGLATHAYSSYYPGYALVLAPLYAVVPYTLAIYPWVQLVNALLAGASAWLLVGIAEALAPDRSASTRWMAAAAVSCYAPALAYTAFALSENLFIPLTLLLALLLLREVRRPGWPQRLAIAGASAGLMLTHPKGVPAVAAFCLAWLVGVWPRGGAERLRVVGWMTAGTLVFLCLRQLAEAFFRHRMGYYSDGVTGHYPDARDILAQLAGAVSMKQASAMLIQFAGQLLYLGVASVGLILVGLVPRRRGGAARTTGTIPDEGEAGQAARTFAVFAQASLLLTMLMTAFFMREGGRVDSLFYGRYDEGVVALVLLPVLLRPPPLRAWWLAGAAMAGLGWILVAAYGSRLHGEVVQLDIFGAQLWRFLGAVGGDRLDIRVLAAAGAVTVVLLGAIRRSAVSSMAVLPIAVSSLFLLAAWQGSLGYLRPESEVNAGRHRIADRIHRDFPEVACVDYDIRAGEYWQRFNDQVQLLPARMHETAVSPSAPIQPDDAHSHTRCSELVISTTPDLGRRYPGARLLERENGSQERLWWIPRTEPKR